MSILRTGGKALVVLTGATLVLVMTSAGCQPAPVGHADHSLQPPEPDPLSKPVDGEPSKATKIPMH